MIKFKNTPEALIKFEEAAISHAKATEQGDYKIGNKYYTIIVNAMAYLKERDEMQKLSEYLDHNSVGVRMSAATYLLAISENQAVKVLTEITGRTDIHSLTAETILSEWRKGNLKL